MIVKDVKSLMKLAGIQGELRFDHNQLLRIQSNDKAILAIVTALATLCDFVANIPIEVDTNK